MRTRIVLPRFFNRSTLTIAKTFLGKFLVRRIGKKTVAAMIVETEAYDGFKDKGSHAHRGKTERNKPMFGEAGKWYVYFTYGMHWMLNIVCGKTGYPAAVLIRGVQGISGPARITKKLGINRKFNNMPANKKTGLWLEDRGYRMRNGWIYPPSSRKAGLRKDYSPRFRQWRIKKGPRIGIDYAGRYWARKPWRFRI